MTLKILQGDCRETLQSLPDESVNCCVTSPPYFGLRDYGVDGQLGLEQTPDEYVAQMVSVFREVRRVLRDDGTLWLNLGDSYAGSGRGLNGDGTPSNRGDAKQATNRGTVAGFFTKTESGLKSKDLIGIPWRVAFALQADGWWLRQDIIWHKPNPMPESVRDRCTKSHEYIFLLSKSAKYWYDADAVMEPVSEATISRLQQTTLASQNGSSRVPGKTNGNMKAVGDKDLRNRRSVWTVTTQGYKDAHFATFPPKLIEPCILAGCPEGGTVLDPFGGSGTTGLVALRLKRNAVLCELNPAYIEMIHKRCEGLQPALI